MENNIEIRPLLNIPNLVHVGDGMQLQYGFDYLWDDDYVYIIDPKRLSRRTGAITSDGVDNEVMNRWLNSIMTNRIEEFIEDENLTLSSISRRKISNWYGKFAPTNIIGTQIHDANGRPYIPGSSIKGALRTAIVATLAKWNSSAISSIGTAKDFEMKFTSGTTERKKSIRSDFFRFVRTTDAFFQRGCEAVITVPRMTVDKMNDIKTILEVIAPAEDETTSFLFNIDVDRYNQMRESRLMDNIGQLPPQLTTIEGWFKLVNEHTLHLIDEEIKAWKLFHSHNAKKYVDTLMLLKDECIGCDDGECILRLGMGSGKIFITGAWAMNLPGMKTPKTRAVYRETDDNLNILGFIKLAKVK